MPAEIILPGMMVHYVSRDPKDGKIKHLAALIEEVIDSQYTHSFGNPIGVCWLKVFEVAHEYEVMAEHREAEWELTWHFIERCSLRRKS
jgi:hypothetical protein